MPGLGLSAGATETRRSWFLSSRTEHDEGRKHRQSAKGADVKGLIQPAEIWTDISEPERQPGKEGLRGEPAACVLVCTRVCMCMATSKAGFPLGSPDTTMSSIGTAVCRHRKRR